MAEDAIEFFEHANFGFDALNLSAQANAQVVRLRIGEQDGFSVPLKLLLSASSSGLGNAEPEQITMNNLISSSGGVVNALVSDIRKVIGNEGSTSSVSISYGAGYKLINGRDTLSNDAINLSTYYLDAGIGFTTGAWVAGSSDKTGTFMLLVKGFLTGPISNSDNIDRMLGGDTNSTFFGVSTDLGIFITDQINFRLGYSRSLSDDNFPDAEPNFLRVGVDYSLGD